MLKRITLGLLFFLVLQVCHLLASVWYLCALFSGSNRANKIALGYDQLGNVTIGGDEDEYISSRCYRKAAESKAWAGLKWILDTIEPDHCKQAYEKELSRKRVFDRR